MDKFSFVQEIAIWVLPVLFAITVHEVAHGWVANLLGDRTALMMGRLTLNPVKHVDLIGTIIVPILCFVGGSVIFGWAKPVPVDWRNLRKPKRDAALVAAAGPIANLGMALIWALITKLGDLVVHQGFANAIFIVYMGSAGISINIVLMVLNLFPIPPLDGSRVVSSLLSFKLARAYDAIEPYGFIILVLLMVTKVLPFILSPAVYWIHTVIFTLFAL